VTVNQSGEVHVKGGGEIGGDADMGGSHDLSDQSHLYPAWFKCSGSRARNKPRTRDVWTTLL
jgi:hypothetical protein